MRMMRIPRRPLGPAARIPAALALLLVLLSGCGPERAGEHRGAGAEVTVRFLDVGQGDAVLVQWNGGAGLVDGGPEGQARALADSLRRYGVRRLDWVIATHPDADHIGGLPPVLIRFPVERFLDSGHNSGSPLQARLLREVKRRGVTSQRARMGESLNVADGLTFLFLGPPEPYLQGTGSDDNNNSVVSLMTYRGTRVLLTGDMETAEWEYVSDLFYGDRNLRADVLKVAHHGSSDATSAALLERVRPKHAVISCERGNPYGHPHRETLSGLKRAGASLYRTDLHGTVTMRTDGRVITFETERRAGRDLWVNGEALQDVDAGN